MECVERTKAVAKAMEEKQFELAVELRGRSFARNLETYKMLTRLKPPKEVSVEGKAAVRTLFVCLFVFFSKSHSSYINFACRRDIDWQ